MLIEHFDILTNDEKERVIWQHGKFLITYHDGLDMCDAYELFEFYVAFCFELNKRFNVEIVSSVYPDELPHLSKIESIW